MHPVQDALSLFQNNESLQLAERAAEPTLIKEVLRVPSRRTQLHLARGVSQCEGEGEWIRGVTI